MVPACSLHIAIIIDQSGSIALFDNEVANIRAGLTTFVNNQLGTGNTVLLIGMGSIEETTPGAAPDGPSTVVYDANTTNANVHSNWITNTLFQDQNTSPLSDAWSTGLAIAAGLPVDLVMIITDGAPGLQADLNGICAAGNTLKSNSQNSGNGAHLFVFCEVPATFRGNLSLDDYLMDGITTNDPALMAGTPPTTIGIGTSDIVEIESINNNSFLTLANWLGGIMPGAGTITTTNISPRSCILHDFDISGLYTGCNLSLASLELRFSNTNGQSVIVPATLNSDGTWTFSSYLIDLVDLGLSYGTWYDVEPILTLTNGTVVVGSEFIAGTNNDLYFAD
ncbi:MAG: hypothetical protein AAFP19_00395 [Bacteroidota bacterium]